MGTLFSALDIGRAGMMVAQVQLDVTGHNISNVNKEGFSRQRVELTTRVPNYKPYGALGRGPAIEGVVRLRESFLDQVYWKQIPGLGEATLQTTYYTQIEDIFQEPSDTGFSTHLNTFFDSLQDFANNVEDLPTRVSLLAEAEAMAATMNETGQRLTLLRTTANEEIRELVPSINSVTGRIAALNEAIRDAELGGNTANDLRDDRDLLVDELAEMVNIVVRERDDGTYDILLGGSMLVTGHKARELETVTDATIDPDRPDFLAVQFADNGEAALIPGGALYGAMQVRDVELRGLEDQLDNIALTLIEAINDIHTQGNGLENIGIALTTSNGIQGASTDPLNTVGLPFTIEDGAFDLVVYDAAGAVIETITVPVDTTGAVPGQTTLEDIRAAIDASASMSAVINADGTLTVTPGAGISFTFANDSSGVLTALGLNGLFTGSSASTIGVSQHLLDHPAYLTSGYSLDVLETGDNTAALAMAAVRSAALMEGGTQTINDYLESMIAQVGIRSQANQDTLDVAEAVVEDYNRRRQEVSAVSVDEEVTSLIQFQRAFEASARVITVADAMLETLVNLVR